MSSDALIRHQLMHGNDQVDPDAVEVRRRELKDIPDYGSQYGASQGNPYINWDTKSAGLGNDSIDWSSERTVALIPVNIQSSTATPYAISGANNVVIAFKAGGYKCLVDRIDLDINGENIINEAQGAVYNTATYQEAIFETLEWERAQSAEEGAALDTAWSTNPTTNTGYAKRVGYFNDLFTFNSTTGVFSGVIPIRLAKLHPYFAGLGARNGVAWTKFTLWLAVNAFRNCPITVVPGTGNSAPTAPPPLITVDGTQSCLLQVDYIKPDTKLHARLKEKALSEHSKPELYYFMTAQPLTSVANSTATTQNIQLGTGLFRPQRVFLNPTPTGDSGYTTVGPFCQSDQLKVNTLMPTVNNAPYLYAPLARSDHFGNPRYLDLWRQLQDLSPGTGLPGETGGLSSFSMWSSSQRYTVLNMSRKGDDDPSQFNQGEQMAVSFNISGTAVAGGYDITPWMLKLACIKTSFQNGTYTAQKIFG